MAEEYNLNQIVEQIVDFSHYDWRMAKTIFIEVKIYNIILLIGAYFRNRTFWDGILKTTYTI